LGDGTIQFVGRTDRQVKFHGIRIDLGEIEAALRRHPSISEVAVVVTGTETDQPGLAAFAALSSNTTDCSALELRAFLHGILPDAVIPGRIELLDALPRTPSGKIDYPVLATRNTPTLPTRPASPPPSSATEQLVAACWEDVLTLTGVGVDDHFFALGGDSLQAIQMLMQVQLRMKKWLPLSAAFFEDPTVRAVAKAIDDAGTDEGA
jgi:fengycin family lipopeptide synthetase D/tyrocidine synthetase-2